MTETLSTGAEQVRWNLDDLYTGLDDSALERDLTAPLADAEGFAARYRNRVGELDAQALAAACAHQEAVYTPLRRAEAYAFLRFSADTSDEASGALLSRVEEQMTAASNLLLFFELEWAAVEDERAARLLDDEAVGGYRHHLESLRRYRPHLRTEGEEQVMRELAQTGQAAWGRLFTLQTSAITVAFDGAERTLDEALSGLFDRDRARRRRAQEAVTEALARDLPTRVFIMNTLLQDKAIVDRLRRHPHWLHSRNLENDADDEQVEALVKAVTGRYDIVARYYRLKARLLGLDELYDYDRYAPLPAGEEHLISWDDARDIVLGAYREFSPEMSDLAGTFFERGWIDAPAAPGKRGGAFAHDVTPDVHPYVLLNFTGRPRDVMTLAHELGHGIHMRLSQSQTLFNAATPLTTAETASIFGETVTLARLMAEASDPLARLNLITQRLDDTFASIFRQVAMNRFEQAVHTARRDRGELSASAIADAWMSTQREMFGDSVTLTDGYASWWSYIPHFIEAPGYVYAYAFGNLLAFALYRTYEEQGPEVVPRYLEMLRAGGSQSPNELARRAGVDLTDPGFWDSGLDVLAAEVADAERLADEIAQQ
ncbi:MAG TPA: M3 family oligoendopeptidase [Egibacteraceae bacterium]|nr:M3 family oligoendopeptidase [Egibacteraceae bacterium]